MNKIFSFVLFFSLFCFIPMEISAVESAATPSGDFIDMYRTFFRDMQAGQHERVWDSLTKTSRKFIAKSLRESALASNEKISETDALEMLNKNISGVRAEYFRNLNEGFEKMSFYRLVQDAEFEVTSQTKDRVVITITVNGDPKRFHILLEDGRWKINFFDDMAF